MLIIPSAVLRPQEQGSPQAQEISSQTICLSSLRCQLCTAPPSVATQRSDRPSRLRTKDNRVQHGPTNVVQVAARVVVETKPGKFISFCCAWNDSFNAVHPVEKRADPAEDAVDPRSRRRETLSMNWFVFFSQKIKQIPRLRILFPPDILPHDTKLFTFPSATTGGCLQ